MNNIPFPYLPPFQPQPIMNVEEEIRSLKQEIKMLKTRIEKLENQNHKNYLQKEEGKYMM